MSIYMRIYIPTQLFQSPSVLDYICDPRSTILQAACYCAAGCKIHPTLHHVRECHKSAAGRHKAPQAAEPRAPTTRIHQICAIGQLGPRKNNAPARA